MFTVTLVRILKGAPLACLVALTIAQEDGLGPQGAEWIERVTGYSDKTVSQGLLFLEELGLISRNGRYLWQLQGVVKQFPLSVLEEKSNRVGKSPTPASSGSSGLIDLINCDSTTTTRTIESEILRVPDPALLGALDAAGIREPARSRLAALEHVTVELIEYHRAHAPAGLAIYRIEHNWPVTDGSLTIHTDYTGGKYSEIVVT